MLIWVFQMNTDDDVASLTRCIMRETNGSAEQFYALDRMCTLLSGTPVSKDAIQTVLDLGVMSKFNAILTLRTAQSALKFKVCVLVDVTQ